MNKRQRLLSAAAATTLGLAGLIGAAAPAQAATTVLDNGDGTITVSGISNPGPDGVSICASSVSATACENAGFLDDLLYRIQANGTYSVGTSTPAAPGGPSTPAPLAAGRYTMVPFTNGFASTALLNVVIGDGGGEESSSSGSSSAPAPVIQQFGMPATGTCDEAQPEGLNLAGVPSGGWGISWAQWMNGGTGGAVCTRTLNYSSAQSKWVVN